jgi:uncharacterized membrane protein YkgB
LGLVLVLGWIGLFKFTPTEAKAIVPLLQHSPLMSWLLPVFGVQGASNLIGTIEVITAVLLLAGTWRPRLLLYGGILATLTFLATLSFLFSTPGVLTQHDGFWVADGFLLKDLTLLGVSISALWHGWRDWKGESARIQTQ